MERLAVYYEALGFLGVSLFKKLEIAKGYERFLYLLNNNGWVFTAFAIMFFSILGFFLLNFWIAFLIILFGIFISLYKELSILSNIGMAVIIYLVSGFFAFVLSAFYEYDVRTETVISITNPAYEVTKDANIILQKGSPEISFSLDSSYFAFIKNSDCKEIKKVTVYENHEGFSEVYRNKRYELYCDDKEIK